MYNIVLKCIKNATFPTEHCILCWTTDPYTALISFWLGDGLKFSLWFVKPLTCENPNKYVIAQILIDFSTHSV